MKPKHFWHNVPRNTPEPSGGGTPSVPTPAPTPDPTPAAGPDLGWIPQDFHKDGAPDLSAFSAHYQELVARDAQRAERDASIPETFAVGLPENLTFEGIEGLPADFKVELAQDDPVMKPLFDGLGETLKKWATDGIPATAGQDLMGLLARYQATEYAAAVKAIDADMAKLGTPAQQQARIGTIERVLDTRLPAEEATALKSLLRSSGAIKAVERLLSPARGTTPPPSTPPGASDENLTASQRLDRANQRALQGAR